MKIGEIKNNAKEFLKENYWNALALCILYIVVAIVIAFISNLVGKIPAIGTVAPMAITICIVVPIAYGWVKNFMDLKYGKTKNVTEFIKGGFDNFERAVSTWWSSSWRKFLKTLPGTIISSIGVILLVVSLVLLFFVELSTLDNVSSTFREELGDSYEEFVETSEMVAENIDVYEKTVGIMFTTSLIFIVIGVLVAMPFALQYIIYDIIAIDRPELSAAEVAKESVNLMKGNRMKYIGLILSFIGWWILCIITCGIGFIFLMPYVQVARISFYESLKGKDSKVVEEVPESVVVE